MLARLTPAIAVMSVALQVLACSQSAPTVVQLARDQTLRAPINAEPRPADSSLDPALVTFPVETAIDDNLFDGLYRVDDTTREQPDVAIGMPDVSADGLTYTFHLRHDVRFWNGAPLTADDVVFSWNRAAALQGGYSSVFQPVAGYDLVASGTSSALSGLVAPNRYTVVATLIQPAGYWLTELSMAAAAIVNRQAIEAGGADRWWQDPNYLVGSGPFRMTSWTRGSELDFEAVPNWWRGGTGALKRIELHVDADPSSRFKGYLEGRYDLLGLGRADLASKDRAQLDSTLAQNPNVRSQVHSWPYGGSTWIQFNLQTGPFSGDGDGALLRRAFARAIDRTKVAMAACDSGRICVPATGGLIAKGLLGYLGDGADPDAKFDAAAARAVVRRLDPDGTRLRGLAFYYPFVGNYDPTQAVAESLRAQWRANLGIDVSIRALDQVSYFAARIFGQFTMWRGGWLFDFNHPADWFDYAFLAAPSNCQNVCTTGAVYDRPGYPEMIASADQKPLSESLPIYIKAGQELVDDSAFAGLFYLVRTALVKPYVRGYGANVMYDYRWTSISILQH